MNCSELPSYDLSIIRGSDRRFKLIHKDGDGNPINLTGYLILLECSDASLSRAAHITDYVNGEYEFVYKQDDTINIVGNRIKYEVVYYPLGYFGGVKNTEFTGNIILSDKVTRKDLHEGSIFHFKLTETEGDVLTDSVEGATIDINDYNLKFIDEGANPNSVLSDYDHAVDTPRVSNTGAKQNARVTSGWLIAYCCADWLPDILDESDGGARVFQIGHNSDLMKDNSFAWQYEPHHKTGQNHIFATQGNSAIPFDLDIAVSEEYDLSLSLHNRGIASYAFAVPVGVSSSPKFFFDDGHRMECTDGIGGTLDSVPGTATCKFDNVDFSNPMLVWFKCHGYVIGTIHLQDEPSDEDLVACCKWHKLNAPAGNKAVWPGWDKYKAG